jgi:uncharacterized membrane protein YtjA (UPF0391 family)
MLKWTIAFAVLALLAALFGFGGLATGFASIAKLLFYAFLVLFIISFAVRAFRGQKVA